MKVTSVGFKRRMEYATVSLIRMSAPKLADDMKRVNEGKINVPLRMVVATATISECLAAKSMAAGA